jgi:ABC-2 type transport system permease protein
VVAHLLRLRFRLLFNGFRRSTWQLVGAIIGALYGLGVLAGIVVAMVGLSFADAEWGRAVAVLAGALLVLGWLIVPLLLRGFDQSLSGARSRSRPGASWSPCSSSGCSACPASSRCWRRSRRP